MRPQTWLPWILIAPVVACATVPPAVQSVPPELEGPVRSQQAERGQQLFERSCTGGRCHGGLGPELSGLGLTPGQVRAQVRGGHGRMPALDPSELSDEELEHILAHLTTRGTIRSSPP
jgi:mono/diheme cytochrome c family protein